MSKINERLDAEAVIACPFHRFGCNATAASETLINEHKMESVGALLRHATTFSRVMDCRHVTRPQVHQHLQQVLRAYAFESSKVRWHRARDVNPHACNSVLAAFRCVTGCFRFRCWSCSIASCSCSNRTAIQPLPHPHNKLKLCELPKIRRSISVL